MIQHLHLPPRMLNERGQCCGRKPIPYKRPPHLFCPKCCADFTPEGKQQQNWAWKRTNAGFVSAYPDSGLHDFINEAKKRFTAEEAS